MQKLRRSLIAWFGLVGLLGALIGPATVFADPISSWTAGPGAILDPTYDGFIDIPNLNSTVPTGGFTVAGWFVDKTAEGWAGADDVQIWQGTMDGGGKMLAKAVFAQGRPDVAAATGNPYWAASGFGGVVPTGALSTGNQTLSVYVHTPGKGWWYKQVNVTASSSAPASAAPAPAPSATTPTVSGGAVPILVIERPTSGENINTGSNGGLYQIMAFSDAAATATYGSQFASAGWRLTFKPTNLHAGSHTLFVYAHSVVTGKEDLETVGMNIVEK